MNGKEKVVFASKERRELVFPVTSVRWKDHKNTEEP